MLVKELSIRGLLSFGPGSKPLSLGSLNVLIGPNGSGKSNFIEAISLLRSAATKLTAPMRGLGGGVVEWFWKGKPEASAHVEVVVHDWGRTQALLHALELAESSARLELVDERIERAEPISAEPLIFYRLEGRQPLLANRDGSLRPLRRQDIKANESILSQRKDPDQYPELAYLAQAYADIRIYREWSFGRSSVLRKPQAADMPSDVLEEDFSNLGLFLNHLRGVPKAKNAIFKHLRDLYAGIDDFDVRVKGGTVEVFLTEGDFTIPAGRLSDGTLRYLCLLAILCDPEPPPLICIEEPELGLHPDMLPKLADLLVEASSRTQLVVTTHSDILVDAMTEHPESVVVFEKRDGQTHMHRLDRDELKQWLDQYRLGQLWTRGQIGGTRW